jgi:hypothetical protein
MYLLRRRPTDTAQRQSQSAALEGMTVANKDAARRAASGTQVNAPPEAAHPLPHRRAGRGTKQNGRPQAASPVIMDFDADKQHAHLKDVTLYAIRH